MEVNALKVEIKHLQLANIAINADIKKINSQLSQNKGKGITIPESNIKTDEPEYLFLMNQVTFQK